MIYSGNYLSVFAFIMEIIFQKGCFSGKYLRKVPENSFIVEKIYTRKYNLPYLIESSK